MRFNTISNKLFMIPMLATAALVAALSVQRAVDNRLAQSQRGVGTAKEIALRMQTVIANQGHYLHHGHLDLLSEIVKDSSAIEEMLGAPENHAFSGEAASTMDALWPAFLASKEIFSRTLETAENIEKERSGMLDRLRVVENMARDYSAAAHAPGASSDVARRELASIFLRSFGMCASEAMSLLELMSVDRLSGYHPYKENLAAEFHKLLEEGDRLSRLTGDPGDRDVWLSAAGHMKALQDYSQHLGESGRAMLLKHHCPVRFREEGHRPVRNGPTGVRRAVRVPHQGQTFL